MNESATHFISVCPHCSASVRINRAVIGHDVVCKHCRGTFLADASKEFIPLSTAEDRAGPSIAYPDQAERIVANCPNCQATLRVRRVYLGKPVLCKQCNHTFPLRDPAAGDGSGRERFGYDLDGKPPADRNREYEPGDGWRIRPASIGA